MCIRDRQSITRAIADQGRVIRIPVHLVESINRVKKTTGELLRKNGREPTAEEIYTYAIVGSIRCV